MADTQQTSVLTDHDGQRSQLTGWVGWIMFAGVIMVIVGLFNAVEGLVALFNHGYYQVKSGSLVAHGSYPVWGTALLIFGVFLIFAGAGVMRGKAWARITGVVVAGVNAGANLGFLAAYPIWITLTIGLDVLVIYALVVHGREAAALRS